MDPTFDFGGPGGDDDEPLFTVRGMLSREDGGVYVANAGAREILAVDGRGTADRHARFRFPEGVSILVATEDLAYGVERDELGVERLRRFRLGG